MSPRGMMKQKYPEEDRVIINLSYPHERLGIMVHNEGDVGPILLNWVYYLSFWLVLYIYCAKFKTLAFGLVDLSPPAIFSETIFFKKIFDYVIDQISLVMSLNPQSRYLKIDVYLLNLMSHDFWRQIVILFSSYKS